MKRPRSHPPAAVVTNQSAPVAGVVPIGAKLKRVGTAVLGYDHRPVRFSRRPTLDALRVAEGERLIEHRHGARGVDTDGEGEAYLRALAPHILGLASTHGGPERLVIDDPLARLIGWASRWCQKALGEISLDELRDLAGQPGKALKADVLAARLRVTRAERANLRLRTIGAIDWAREERQAARGEDARLRKAEARRQAGARSYADSQEATSPWTLAGLSRRTWFRRQRAEAGTTSSTTPSGISEPLGTGTSTTEAALFGDLGTGTATVDSFAISYCGRSGANVYQAPDAVQLSLLPSPQADDELRSALDGWTSGPIPEAVIVGYIAAKRRRAVRQEDIAKAIGISRPQLANALQRTFNLSSDVIGRLSAWLLADDETLPTAPITSDSDRPARPHHRRGGKRPPDPGPAIPSLRLFALVVDQPRPAAAITWRIAA